MIEKITYIESTTTNPYLNLALEEELFNTCTENEIILYLWRNSNAVVIGKNQNAWRECNVTKIDEDAVILVRRMSGGGAVFHDTYNLNFTFICHKKNYDVDKQLCVIIDALKSFGIEAEKSGRNDILVNGRKFSGNAFYQRGGRCYHHGTLMVDVDTEKLSKYLTVSKAKLMSKGVESVKSRVINLVELEPEITIPTLKSRLKDSFEKIYEHKAEIIFPADKDICNIAINMDKYISWEWTFGRKIDFKYELSNRFLWGEIVLHFNVYRGLIHELKISCDSMNVEIINYIEEMLSNVKYERKEICAALNKITEKKYNSIYGDESELIICDLIKWFSEIEL